MNREAQWGAMGVDFKPPVEGPRNIRKVAVLGHSYVRDLRLPARTVIEESNLAIHYRNFFTPGATVTSIQTSSVWERLIAYKPELTFLLIGGNDITPESSPRNIARSIIAVAKRIKDETGGEICILTIERRPNPCGVSFFRYNQQRNSINRFLKHRDPFTKNRLIFSEARDGDSQDGVHLRLRALDDLAYRIEQHSERFASLNC